MKDRNKNYTAKQKMDTVTIPPSYQASGVLQNHDCYIRLVTMINHATLELYYKIFHDSKEYGFSTDPVELNRQLRNYKDQFQIMKKEGNLLPEELELLFPISNETYSQEFSIPLFHKLCQTCLLNWDENNNMDNEHRTNNLNVLDTLDRIKDIYQSENLMNMKMEEFESSWNEVQEVLVSLNYDVKKLTELKTDPIDNKRFRFALIKTEMNLLNTEINNLFKTTKINTFTIEKLLLNQQDALDEYQEEFHEKKGGLASSPLLRLKDDIELTSKMLLTLKNSVKSLFPDMKFWREKNIEGDIIIIDEKLSKLKNQVNNQSFNVSNFFNSISFDIVKMKERVNNQEKNDQYIVNTMTRTKSNTSLLSSSHDNLHAARQQRQSALIN